MTVPLTNHIASIGGNNSSARTFVAQEWMNEDSKIGDVCLPVHQTNESSSCFEERRNFVSNNHDRLARGVDCQGESQKPIINQQINSGSAVNSDDSVSNLRSEQENADYNSIQNSLNHMQSTDMPMSAKGTTDSVLSHALQESFSQHASQEMSNNDSQSHKLSHHSPSNAAVSLIQRESTSPSDEATLPGQSIVDVVGNLKQTVCDGGPLHKNAETEAQVSVDNETSLSSSTQNSIVGNKRSVTQNEGREQTSFRKRPRKSFVWDVLEWTFPPGTADRFEYITSALENSDETKHLVHKTFQQAITVSQTTIRKRIVKREKQKDKTTTLIYPKITGAEFDSRFIEYATAPDGSKKEELLVRTAQDSKSKNTPVSIEENVIIKIPDIPPRLKSRSRVGPFYQARIPKLKDPLDASKDLDEIPGYEILWDPKLAEQAQERGEDVYGFLEGEHELEEKEILLKILHANNYNVNISRTEYERLKSWHGRHPAKLSKDEASQFDSLINEHKKKITLIAEKLNRTNSECIVHYYVWKATNRNYPRLKKEWKSDYCAVCDDGGDLLYICDGCHNSYHLKCIKLKAKDIPDGDWYCYKCKSSSVASPGFSRRHSYSIDVRAVNPTVINF